MNTEPDTEENTIAARQNAAYAGGLRLQAAHTRQRDIEVMDAMHAHGGGFVKSLSLAFRLADAENLAKIKTAFAPLWAKYDAIAHPEDQEGA